MSQNSVVLTAEQESLLDDTLDHLLGLAKAAGQRLNELGEDEGLPSATPDEMAAIDSTFSARAIMRGVMAEQFAGLTDKEIAERRVKLAESTDAGYEAILVHIK